MTTCTENCNHSFVETSFSLFRSPGQMLQHSFEILKLKAIVGRERRQLLEMSDEMLKDMGITRTLAVKEAQRVDIPEIRLINLAKKRC